MKYFKRLLWYPWAFLKAMFCIINEKARDIENQRKFSNAIIDSGCCFTNDTTIGNHSRIMTGAIINHSHIGNYSYCNRNVLIQNTTIGNYCSIANDVIIGLGAHPTDDFSTSPIFYRISNPLKLNICLENSNFEEYKPIKIGSDVWIGARAIIMDGVIIGHGAVVAAGAVVSKDVLPYSIVGGVPAKIIKYRFEEGDVKKISHKRWWDKPAEEVFAKKEDYQI